VTDGGDCAAGDHLAKQVHPAGQFWGEGDAADGAVAGSEQVT